jgi:YVTN family beta-propeller protein
MIRLRSRLFRVVALVAPFVLAAATGQAAQPGPAPAAAAAGGAERVYVTNERSGTLSVVDAASGQVTATVPLGKRPRGLKLSPDGRLLYVALSGSPIAGPGVDESKLPPADKGADGIGVVDLTTLKLLRVLRGVSDPEQLAVSHDGRTLYVASEDTGRALVIDAADGRTIASLKVGGEPEGVTISPDGRHVYVTSEEDHSVSVIDTAANRVVASLEVGQRPRFTSFTPDGRLAFVSGENDGTITVIDAVKHRVLRVIRLDGGPLMRPVGMAVSGDAKTLYVVTGRGGQLLAVDVASGRVLRQVAVGPRPWGVELGADGRRLYTANGSSNDISIVDVASFTVTAKVPVGDAPWGLIVAPAPAPAAR